VRPSISDVAAASMLAATSVSDPSRLDAVSRRKILMSQDGGDMVENAVLRVESRCPELGDPLRLVADMLWPGEGVDQVHQASLQDFLWLYLPRDHPVETWPEMVSAAAAILEELGFGHLAALTRSRQTAEVLAAWEKGMKSGYAAFRSAREASGVQPPDTEVLEWGSVMGADEAMALEAVERVLGERVARRELVPGAPGWRASAASITEQALTLPLDLPPGQTLSGLVVTERISSWIHSASHPLHRQWRSSVANRLLNPIGAPEDAASVVAPFRWLLELASAEGGVPLTQSNYLSPASVVDAAERFGWWDWPKPPRSEADVHQLGAVRAAAARLHLTRRRGRRLHVTSRGARLLARPSDLWRTVATQTEDAAALTSVVTELVGLRLLQGPCDGERLAEEVAPILAAQGWRSSKGEPVTKSLIGFEVWAPIRWWTIFSVVDDEWPTWEQGTHRQLTPHTLSLHPGGVAMAQAFLRARAAGPRTAKGV
jgi:hypothetical protein